MKMQFLPFQTAIDRCCGQPKDRACAVALSVAVALAASATIPSSQVDEPARFYEQNVAPELERLAAAFNENVVFDLELTLQMARAQWLIRYTAAHPFSIPAYVAGDCGFYEALFGVHLREARNHRDFLNANPAPVLRLAKEALTLIEELKKNG